MILHYLTIALRGLMKYKWQHIVSVAGLTIGLTAFVFGGYWWYWEHHFDDFHPQSHYVYAITTTGISKDVNGAPTELNQLHRDDAGWMLENIPAIEKSCCIRWATLQYKTDDKSETITGLNVDSTFFSMFYAEFIDGDYRHLPYDESHIVLTERAAMKYFGKTDCTGTFFPGANKKVAGVIRNYPSNSEFRFDFLSLSPSVYNGMGRTTFYVQINRHAQAGDVRERVENHKSVAQLRFDQGAEKNWYHYSTLQFPYVGLVFHLFNKEALEPYRCAYIKIKPENRALALEHVQKVWEAQQIGHLTEGDQVFTLSDVMNRLNRPERMLSLIFGVLSLACILVVSFGVYALISLTIEQRRREIAIRKVNGAEFADMLRLFFREYLLLVAIGNMFALALGYFLMLRWFETYVYRTALSWWLFVLTLVTTGVIVFLSVVSKIREAARVEPAEALKYEN